MQFGYVCIAGYPAKTLTDWYNTNIGANIYPPQVKMLCPPSSDTPCSSWPSWGPIPRSIFFSMSISLAFSSLNSLISLSVALSLTVARVLIFLALSAAGEGRQGR